MVSEGFLDYYQKKEEHIIMEREGNHFIVVVKAEATNGLVRAIRIQYNAFLFFSFCTIITTYREYEGQANTIIGLAFFLYVITIAYFVFFYSNPFYLHK
jgi:hypothetical protein